MLCAQSRRIKSKVTSDAGSQYRCGRVGRGSQPWYTPNTPPNSLSNTDTYTESFKTLVFSLFDLCSQTDGRTDRRTDKVSYRIACPQLKIQLSIILECSQWCDLEIIPISQNQHGNSVDGPWFVVARQWSPNVLHGRVWWWEQGWRRGQTKDRR